MSLDVSALGGSPPGWEGSRFFVLLFLVGCSGHVHFLLFRLVECGGGDLEEAKLADEGVPDQLFGVAWVGCFYDVCAVAECAGGRCVAVCDFVYHVVSPIWQ